MVNKRNPLVSFRTFLKLWNGDFQLPPMKSHKTKRQKSQILARLSLKSQTKAQLKIQQMAFMLMAVTLFFVLVGMFILVIRFSGLKQSATILEEENAMLLVTKLANSPEFSCGEAFGSNRINCVDADKVMMLKENIVRYSKFWGVAKIEIRKIYPDKEGIECTSTNYENCGVIKVFSKNVNSLPPSSNFISLCRKEADDNGVYDKCELARLMISSEDKS